HSPAMGQKGGEKSTAAVDLQPTLPKSDSLLGLSHRHALAEDLLQLLGQQVPLAQCTIFAFEAGRRPTVVAVGDRARTLALPDIAQAYVKRFYRLDGSATAMRLEWPAALKASEGAPRTVLHRQRPEDIAHAEYRRTCYELPEIAERLAVMALFEKRRWLAVHLYRGQEHGPFDAAGIAVVEAFAPLIVHAVRLHHTGQTLAQELPDVVWARLARRFPALTQRDEDVLRALMAGLGTEALAERLGLTLASARTYQKRVYRKLGVAGQRELLGLLFDSAV
ncbi:MAG: helix-turn-helix transcriptional regulator, partial [Hydrogenophaga sp.]